MVGNGWELADLTSAKPWMFAPAAKIKIPKELELILSPNNVGGKGKKASGGGTGGRAGRGGLGGEVYENSEYLRAFNRFPWDVAPIFEREVESGNVLDGYVKAFELYLEKVDVYSVIDLLLVEQETVNKGYPSLACDLRSITSQLATSSLALLVDSAPCFLPQKIIDPKDYVSNWKLSKLTPTQKKRLRRSRTQAETSSAPDLTKNISAVDDID